MTESLPYGGFQWVEDFTQSDFFNIPDNHHYGYFLEVDLEYPHSLHDRHKDLPFYAEHIIPPGSKQKKLLTTLNDKVRYVIHYRALKQAVKHGLKIKKIHRALRFKQSQWLKSYIDLNSKKRKDAKNEFEKMLFKLFNNAVYGKTMENQRKHVDVKLVTKWHGRYGAEALIAKPNFHSRDIFDGNLIAVQLTKSEVCIRKPIYIGLAVLDLSKILLYRFHYDYMQNRVGDNSKLLYTDTDSLIYEVTNVNMYDVMREDIDEFDTSDYPESNQFDIPLRNKKVVGLMKDECNGEIMLEFVGLRSKMYSVRVQNKKQIKKAKGVKSCVVNTTITFEDYIKCLKENSSLTREQRQIRSRHHQLFSEKQRKIALSAHDDKRYLLPGETDTLPWGHKDIVVEEEEADINEEEEANRVEVTADEIADLRDRIVVIIDGVSAIGDELDAIRDEVAVIDDEIAASGDEVAGIDDEIAVIGSQIAGEGIAVIEPPSPLEGSRLYQAMPRRAELILSTAASATHHQQLETSSSSLEEEDQRKAKLSFEPLPPPPPPPPLNFEEKEGTKVGSIVYQQALQESELIPTETSKQQQQQSISSLEQALKRSKNQFLDEPSIKQRKL